MSNLLDLSGKIDPQSTELFATVSQTAELMGIPFFVVGATARDMIFELGHGRQTRRATLDRDFGVRLESWTEFAKWKESLLATKLFTETRGAQRLVFQGKLEVDIVPFGGLADKHGDIRWPPDENVVMSTVGFEDAYHAAQKVRVRANPPLDILVASISGLTILKLISWADRPQARSRDAIDLAFILEKYLDAGNHERLYEEHFDLVDVEGFDYERAGARLLGRDVAKIATPETKKRITEILIKETSDEGRNGRLIQGMMPAGTVFGGEGRSRFTKLLDLLSEFQKGLDD